MDQLIYNTQSKKKEVFKPIHEGEVRMYVCGPTVYDFLHIGNFRGAIFFNLVRNWFEKLGYKVTYVYNYTDVDDKIIKRAQDEGVESIEISEKYIKEFEKDYAQLKLKPHTHNPKVTDTMGPIIQFIEKLIANGSAYEAEGEVFFDVSSYDQYGKLSNKNIDDMLSGSRIEIDVKKKNPVDFTLWKPAKPGEPSWDSPWGKGRPGWHIECSVMSTEILGETLDIHGGGLDLVFPHHENEIAQSEGCTGHTYVNYWMHNNMLEFGDQKMSKSLGNVRTARSFLEEFNAEILKFMMLNAHYRSVVDFGDAQLEKSISQLARIYSSMAFAEKVLSGDSQLAPIPDKFQKTLDEASEGIEKALLDDFNTAEVMARIFEVIRSFNNLVRTPGKVTPEKTAIAEAFLPWLKKQGEVMALFQEEAAEYLTILDDMLLNKKGLKRSEVDDLVQKRGEARANKDFATADEVRNQLNEWGIAVQDTADGSTWEVQK